MGHKNSSKVLVPCVVSMVEELMIMLRPHARVRSHKCHAARGGSAVEKKLQRGLALTWLEGWWHPTFNASHQTSLLHLCGEDSWIVLPWPLQLTRDLGKCLMGQALEWWTRRSTNWGPRWPEGRYIMWETLQGGGGRKPVEKTP